MIQVRLKKGESVERGLKRLKKILDKLPLPDNVGIVVRTVGAGASARAFARDLRNLLSVWNEMQGNVKNLRTPCCIFQEPDLCERVIRDWLTEDVDSIVIDDPAAYDRMAKAVNPYGDGKACPRIAQAILSHFLPDAQPPEPFVPAR